jgi:REP element-mobilizing transposase RayT
MKRRDYKNLSKNSIYHLYNRGNNKENIFHDEQDHRAFLFRLGLAIGIKSDDLNKNNITKSPKSRIRITKSPYGIFKLHAFCLMPNHFHLLIEQCSDISISILMKKVCTSFAMYMNKKNKRVGYLFQDRFKSTLIENNSQLMWTISYIHMNPIKSRLVLDPSEYKWSSYNDFAYNRDLPIISKDLIIPIFGTKENFIKETFTLSKDLSRSVLDTKID